MQMTYCPQHPTQELLLVPMNLIEPNVYIVMFAHKHVISCS